MVAQSSIKTTTTTKNEKNICIFIVIVVCNCNCMSFKIVTRTEQNHNKNNFRMVISSAFKVLALSHYLCMDAQAYTMTDDVTPDTIEATKAKASK